MTRQKICLVVSAPMTISAFLRDQVRALSAKYDLTVVANSNDDAFLKSITPEASFYSVKIPRRISPLADASALWALFLFFTKNHFELVHSVTPKAGLLAMMAGCFAGIPIRIHTFTGQVWATKRGLARMFLMLFDRLIAVFATNLLVDSPSQRDFLIKNRIVSKVKSQVLGEGSISGVDLDRFRANLDLRSSVRRELALSEKDVVFLYVGRLNRDKGIPELLRAFEGVAEINPLAHLLLVGPDEENLGQSLIMHRFQSRIHRVDYTTEPERFMAAGDVFVLPSHREGFGSTVIESAAVGIPSIASRIYGLTDAVLEGKTGLLHDPKDEKSLQCLMAEMASSPEMRENLGRNAQKRASEVFPMRKITNLLLDFYEVLLTGHTTPSHLISKVI